MRDKLQAELRILMHILPLSEKAAIEATQRVNIDPSGENINKLLDASSQYRVYVELINFIVRVLDEVPE